MDRIHVYPVADLAQAVAHVKGEASIPPFRRELGEEERPVEGRLTGQQYVITGTLEAFTRETATAALEALGAKVSDSVSGKTTGLIVGAEPGAAKLRKAEKAGARLLTEADLIDLLNG